jgi:hypothetical protein
VEKRSATNAPIGPNVSPRLDYHSNRSRHRTSNPNIVNLINDDLNEWDLGSRLSDRQTHRSWATAPPIGTFVTLNIIQILNLSTEKVRSTRRHTQLHNWIYRNLKE